MRARANPSDAPANPTVARACRIAVVATVAACVVSACTTANPVMTFFFDRVPAPGETYVAQDVVKQPRRPTYKKPPPKVKFVEVLDLPPPIDWKARYAELPRNDSGAVAWTKALNGKAIEPKPGIAPDAKDEDPTDMDVEIATSGQAEYKVVFAHKPHTQWMACPACHTGIFEMEKGKTKMTMEKMGAGEQCGACHGKVASPEISECPVCHAALGKS